MIEIGSSIYTLSRSTLFILYYNNFRNANQWVDYGNCALSAINLVVQIQGCSSPCAQTPLAPGGEQVIEPRYVHSHNLRPPLGKPHIHGIAVQ